MTDNSINELRQKFDHENFLWQTIINLICATSERHKQKDNCLCSYSDSDKENRSAYVFWAQNILKLTSRIALDALSSFSVLNDEKAKDTPRESLFFEMLCSDKIINTENRDLATTHWTYIYNLCGNFLLEEHARCTPPNKGEQS